VTREASSTRLDRHLVDAGLARARGEARELIQSGAVQVQGVAVIKPAYVVTPGAPVEVAYSTPRWVGRGARKLDHAFSLWGPRGLTASGKSCLDIGASTGGFTQVLLTRGASHVVALDVGHGQLVQQLSADPRVTERSGTHIRDTTVATIGGPAELVVVDLSFISLASVVSLLPPLCVADADLVLLVKPQFEVGPQALGHGGVVRSPVARRHALETVLHACVSSGLHIVDLSDCPVRGARGNHEYLLWLSPRSTGTMELREARTRAAAITAQEER